MRESTAIAVPSYRGTPTVNEIVAHVCAALSTIRNGGELPEHLPPSQQQIATGSAKHERTAN